MKNKAIIALDIGEKRIGVATADTTVKIAVPLETITVDGNEIESIVRVVTQESANLVVIGYPRNQSGQSTAQTRYVEEFSKKLQDIAQKIVFQDESLTSILAEQQLKSHKKPYTKADIDGLAAALILQDYLEKNS